MLKDLLKKSRSYRSFDESVMFTEEQLKEFVDHVRYAPSSINRQTLRYRLIFEPDEVRQMRPLTTWAIALKDYKLPPEGHHATAFIVICQDTESRLRPENYMKDVGICAQMILLAAAEAGYGGCMIGSFRPDQVAAAFHIPERYAPTLVVALGKPDEEITLVPVGEDGDIRYYRDENGHHFVPKRSLEEILIK